MTDTTEPRPIKTDWAGRPLENIGPRIVQELLADGERLDAVEWAHFGKHPYLRQVCGSLLFGSSFHVPVREGQRRVSLPAAAWAVVTDRRFMIATGSMNFRTGQIASPATVLLEVPRNAARVVKLGGHAMFPAVYVDFGGRPQRLSFRYKRQARDSMLAALGAALEP